MAIGGGSILGSAQTSISSGVGTAEEYAPNTPQVDKSVDTLKKNGTPMPDGSVDEQHVGLIGQAGGNCISTGGLNLIGQAGGNMIALQQ